MKTDSIHGQDGLESWTQAVSLQIKSFKENGQFDNREGLKTRQQVLQVHHKINTVQLQKNCVKYGHKEFASCAPVRSTHTLLRLILVILCVITDWIQDAQNSMDYTAIHRCN